MSFRRHMIVGAAIVGLLATLFALAVVSFADCVGEHCTRERIVGVVGHALGGMVLGVLLGAGAAAVRRLLRR